MYLEKSFLPSFTSLARFQISFGSPDSTSTSVSNVFSFILGSRSSHTPFVSILFYVWAQLGPLCSSMLAFFQLVWLSAHWDRSFLCWGGHPWRSTGSEGCLLPGNFLTGSCKQVPEQAKINSSNILDLYCSAQNLKLKYQSQCRKGCFCPLGYPPAVAHAGPTEHLPLPVH